jgi:hypothetical protein
MRQSRSTETQIVAILKVAEAGQSITEVCRQHGISCATFTMPPSYAGREKRSCGRGLCSCLEAGCQRRICKGSLMVRRQDHNVA